MPDGGLTEFLAYLGSDIIGGDIGAALIMSAPEIATALQVTAAVYTLREQQRRSESKAKDAYNSSLRDRYVMVRGATEPRQLVLGRQRVSGPIGFIKSYGAQNEHLVFTVILAAHELDAIEAIYFDDEPVVIDSSGNVTATQRQDEFSIAAASGTFTISSAAKAGSITALAKYGSTITPLTVGTVSGTSVTVSGANAAATGLLVITYAPDPCPFAPTDTLSLMETFTSTSNPQTFTLSGSPSLVVYAASTTGAGQDIAMTTYATSVSGNNVTVTGAPIGTAITISYQSADSIRRARVRKYLGTASQTADAAMVTNLGGVWTSAHVGAGLAYLVVELDYNQDSFPGGIPNVSAVVRGLKCYDPRSGATAWTDNPALLLRAYATHALGGRQAASAIDDASISTAANVCDTSTGYVLGGNTDTRKLYAAGLATKTGIRPSDVLNDLAQAMGGRWAMVDGKLKVKAGSYTSPVLSLDESWLHEGGAVTIQPGRNRADVINQVTGTFADETSDYKVVQFPRVSSSGYISTDGAELPTDMQMAGVTFTGQAQFIAAAALRYARAALTIKLTCNLKAYQAEPFDVIAVSLARFGWTSKTFEVLDTSWTLDGGIELTLKAIDSTIWALDAGYVAGVPAGNTRLPSPWGIPVVAGLSAVSDASTVQRQPDGSMKARIRASWTAVADQRVTQSGAVEIKWGLATDPENQWMTFRCEGSTVRTYLDPVHVGASYIVKARTVTASATSAWCTQVLCAVSNTTSFGGVIDTPQLADNSVTVVSSADLVASLTFASGTGTTILSTVVNSGNKPITVNISVMTGYSLVGPPGPSDTISLQVLFNGNTVKTTPNTYVTGLVTINMIVSTPGIGSITISVKGINNGSLGAYAVGGSTFMTVLATKK